jgi:hypothetical protein
MTLTIESNLGLSTSARAAQSVDIEVMERRELIRRLVLNSICDVFENVDQIILRDVTRDGSKFGLTIERTDIVDALKGLIEDGLAKAYLLRGTGPDPFAGELPGMPPLDVVEEDFQTYFYITKKGMDFHLADDSWWPFEDEAETPK